LTGLRTARGLTQAEVARRIGIDPTNYARLESGRHVPSPPTLLRVADVLAVRLDRIVAVEAGDHPVRRGR
jgi:transcriptional regulator with XRE-family HTH domain